MTALRAFPAEKRLPDPVEPREHDTGNSWVARDEDELIALHANEARARAAAALMRVVEEIASGFIGGRFAEDLADLPDDPAGIAAHYEDMAAKARAGIQETPMRLFDAALHYSPSRARWAYGPLSERMMEIEEMAAKLHERAVSCPADPAYAEDV